MIRVVFHQPALPEYRLPLFKRLVSDGRFSLQLFVSDGIPGCPKTVFCEMPYVRVVKYFSLFGGRILWQKNLNSLSRSTDVMVICGNPRYISSMLGLIIAKIKGIPTIWWGQGWSSTSKPWRACIRRWLMRIGPDYILLYTHKEAEKFIDMGFSPEKTFFLNNTLDSKQIDYEKNLWSQSRLKEFQAYHGLNEKVCLLYCGRIVSKSELEVLIKALSLLKGRYFDKIRLNIIGDGDSLPDLKNLSQNLGVSDIINWCGSLYNENDLAPWFMSSSIFVYPGSIGLSINHAFSYGLPVIAHNDFAKQGPEFAYLKEGFNGITFSYSDYEDLAASISKLIDQPSLLHEMSKEALITIRDICPFDGMVGRFIDILNKASKIKRFEKN